MVLYRLQPHLRAPAARRHERHGGTAAIHHARRGHALQFRPAYHQADTTGEPDHFGCSSGSIALGRGRGRRARLSSLPAERADAWIQRGRSYGAIPLYIQPQGASSRNGGAVLGRGMPIAMPRLAGQGPQGEKFLRDQGDRISYLRTIELVIVEPFFV